MHVDDSDASSTHLYSSPEPTSRKDSHFQIAGILSRSREIVSIPILEYPPAKSYNRGTTHDFVSTTWAMRCLRS